MFKFIFIMLVWVMSSQSYAYNMQDMLDKHLLPTYENLAEQTAELNQTANSYCVNPSSAGLESLKAKTRDTFLAWQAAQHIRFGPVLAFSRDRRFDFWPDKRGTIRKQLYELVNGSALEAEDFDITHKSVAVQGLSTLEQLLNPKSDDAEVNCFLVASITQNLHTMANDLASEWASSSTPFVDLFLNPGEDNYIYRSESELGGELINTLYTQLEFMVTRKLDLPLGSSMGKARGKLSEGWRSHSSLAALSANLNACHEFYRYSFAPQLKANPLDEKIESAFKQVQATLEEIDIPLSQAVSDAEKRLLVVRLKQELTQLKNLVASDVADILGIALGFNSLDGD